MQANENLTNEAGLLWWNPDVGGATHLLGSGTILDESFVSENENAVCRDLEGQLLRKVYDLGLRLERVTAHGCSLHRINVI
jgi:hypothetical protein